MYPDKKAVDSNPLFQRSRRSTGQTSRFSRRKPYRKGLAAGAVTKLFLELRGDPQGVTSKR